MTIHRGNIQGVLAERVRTEVIKFNNAGRAIDAGTVRNIYEEQLIELIDREIKEICPGVWVHYLIKRAIVFKNDNQYEEGIVIDRTDDTEKNKIDRIDKRVKKYNDSLKALGDTYGVYLDLENLSNDTLDQYAPHALWCKDNDLFQSCFEKDVVLESVLGRLENSVKANIIVKAALHLFLRGCGSDVPDNTIATFLSLPIEKRVREILDPQKRAAILRIILTCMSHFTQNAKRLFDFLLKQDDLEKLEKIHGFLSKTPIRNSEDLIFIFEQGWFDVNSETIDRIFYIKKITGRIIRPEEVNKIPDSVFGIPDNSIISFLVQELLEGNQDIYREFLRFKEVHKNATESQKFLQTSHPSYLELSDFVKSDFRTTIDITGKTDRIEQILEKIRDIVTFNQKLLDNNMHDFGSLDALYSVLGDDATEQILKNLWNLGRDLGGNDAPVLRLLREHTWHGSDLAYFTTESNMHKFSRHWGSIVVPFLDDTNISLAAIIEFVEYEEKHQSNPVGVSNPSHQATLPKPIHHIPEIPKTLKFPEILADNPVDEIILDIYYHSTDKEKEQLGATIDRLWGDVIKKKISWIACIIDRQQSGYGHSKWQNYGETVTVDCDFF